MISIYISAFDLIKHDFPYQKNLDLACKFGDEVVVAVNTSTDGTIDALRALTKEYPNLRIIETNFSYDDIRFDGLIKNAALQATKEPVKIQLDMDEFIPLNQKPRWLEWAERLKNSNVGCFLVPSLDLFGSPDTIRADKIIGYKFRMHKAGYRRGVWQAAMRGDKINTSMSDTCELIDINDQLCEAASVVPEQFLSPIFCRFLNNYIFTVHEGYLSLDRRVKLNNEFWRAKWEDRSGMAENLASSIDEFKNVPTVKHGLSLWT